MLPAYYGLLRLCCQQSRSLTRQLAAHQNLQWAFKNIIPQYVMAVDELFALMNLFAALYQSDHIFRTKAQFTNIVKNHPRPPRLMSSMVQMSVPQSQLIQRGIDKEFDAALDAFYRPYHDFQYNDFLYVMMRMAVNVNTLNDSNNLN